VVAKSKTCIWTAKESPNPQIGPGAKENHNIIATYDLPIAVKAYFCVTSVHAQTANACSAYVAAIMTISLSK
jgi:hypothetical protein